MVRSKVIVYTSSGNITGYVTHLPRQRLLDLLNGLLAGAMRTNEYFLHLTDVTSCDLDGKERVLQSTYVKMANIFFAKEIEKGHIRQEYNPYVKKVGADVKLYMTSYILTGKTHCAQLQSLRDMLNSEMRFLPLTDVQIYTCAGLSESEVSFIAVNKDQIIYLEDMSEAKIRPVDSK